MLEIAKEAASVAGAFLKERFLEQLVPDEELHNDVKLPEDKESERRIIEIIHGHFPTHTIFSEEVGMVSRDEEYLWIVDPLDGTNNYFIGYPYFSVSIALQHRGELVLGVVYNPVAGQMFWAEKGKGAYLNGKRISVNKRTDKARAVGTYIRGRNSITKEQELTFTNPFVMETKRVLRNVGPALDWCLLANGWIEYIVMQRSGIMDVAAGIVIAEEAGATITDWQGVPYQHEAFESEHMRSLVASNGLLHETIRVMIHE
ncbi:inositol monophosphatase [Brevibacillus reuszeri]|uniref:Inositol-1-monophosphatase n=1 Tax=Brevibacillus reuszeri TaxID=54915 RepID=A0A0K9YIX0_9BACL|nr:inositol monophosphatase [Brevibacillus reuszeri]KNB68643.1 inositol-1-monophosphatase [Brevibacillus reuszeri]GED69145.1 inositol monophosphatase [Brevibacillus reuszeri]